MVDSDDISRRRLLRSGAAALGVSGLAGKGAAFVDVTVDSSAGDAEASADESGVDADTDAEQAPPLSVVDRTETITVGGLPERAGGIRPGSQMLIELADGGTAGCTANFIWRDSEQLYIGAAGHCFLGEGPADSRAARQHEEGTDTNQRIDAVKVCADCTFGGATGLLVQGPVIELGDVVYARQTSPVEDDDGGVGHDFGLVEIKPDQEEAVDPSMPEFGGPTGVSDAAVPAGTPINQYGAGIGNGEVYPTQGSNGSSLGDGGTDNDAWFAALRATPGDSGSPIQSSAAGTGIEGDEAAGILTHITTLGTAGTTMGRCKEMVAEDIDKDIEAVLPGEL